MTAPGAGGRRLWLVRHGETEGQSSIRFHGRNDVPLSALGRAQIEALAPLFAGLAPAVVVHSPLGRAAASAALLATAHGWGPHLLRGDERLRELSFGDCEGMTADEIAAAFPEFWARRQRGDYDAYPGGEPRAAFAARVGAAIEELAGHEAGGDIVVVAHRGIVRQALRRLLHLGAGDPDPPPGFAVRLGSLTVLRCAAAAGADAAWAVELYDYVP